MTEKKIIASIANGMDFKNIFEKIGLLISAEELQKTKVVCLRSPGGIDSFISFINTIESSIKITHYFSPDEYAPTMFDVLDKYCLENDINTIVVSIPANIRGLLAIYKRAGFKKVCDGFEYSTGDLKELHTHDLIKKFDKDF
jgi:L-amino acid N-acyltransferase YncA